MPIITAGGGEDVVVAMDDAVVVVDGIVVGEGVWKRPSIADDEDNM